MLIFFIHIIIFRKYISNLYLILCTLTCLINDFVIQFFIMFHRNTKEDGSTKRRPKSSLESGMSTRVSFIVVECNLKYKIVQRKARLQV